MTTLVQVLPTSAMVRVSGTDGYTTQLSMIGAVGALTYTLLSPPSSLVVSRTGQVASTGTLEVGDYTVFGDVVDTQGNEGTWLFTLHVISSVVPLASVTAMTPAPPTGVEILTPFQIDPATGAVAVARDYVQILEQHIISILLTSQPERLMAPTYGAGLERVLFGPIGGQSTVFLTKDIQSQLEAWEPAIRVQGVTVTPNGSDPSLLDISVSFSVVPFNDVSTVTVSTGGAVVGGVSP